MKRTSKKPTKPGYWWVWCRGETPYVEDVFAVGSELHAAQAESNVAHMWMGTLWSDAPIEKPE